MKKYFLKCKLVLLCLCILFILVFTTGCRSYKGYHGEYPELWTVAVHNLLGTRGYFQQGGIVDESQIKVVEEDSYGRVLFAYTELSEVSSINLLIMQKKDDNYAYYYPDYCFVSNRVPSRDYSVLNYVIDDYLSLAFPEKLIERLKEQNDWNKDIDETKCVRREITRAKKEPKIREELLEKLYNIAIHNNDENNTVYKYSIYFTSDSDGRMIFLSAGITSSQTDPKWVYYVFIINRDWSYLEEYYSMRLADLYNYQITLRTLKQLNNWSE